MADYKNTLNLPHTSFPMKASLSQREPTMLEHWKDSGLYQKIREARKDAKRFILHDGPPYANGHLHCGHALNKILKDIIVKSKTLSGYDAPFKPGWDCHGLPIELNVEKKVGKVGAKLTAREFRQKCREYASSQVDIQREEFKRLGVFGSWEHPYISMDAKYEANTVRALAKIIAQGHLQQGFKPVHWCIDCGSALAEAEVDYEDKHSASIDVAFYAVDSLAFLKKFGIDLEPKSLIVPIWTTTPWTLPANEAVCLHPELEYALVDAGKHYFVVASELVETVMGRYGVEKYTTKGRLLGSELELLALQHPFYSRGVPIVLGEHVTTESGTGNVHTAPAHGPDDYLVGKKYQLPLINPVLGNGCYSEEVEYFAGQHVTKANANIVDIMHDKGVLLHQETLNHSYPHCWRHKTPVIFRATPQWFISMEKNGLREAILSQIEKVTWIPDWGKARIRLMVENRPDWCISRQRAWGTPIPLFVHQTTRELHPNSVELMEKVASLIEDGGIDAWFDLDPKELLGDEASAYEKINDTLDVWFDSGISHFCVLEQAESLGTPADLYFEGSDQHRGWFNSSITTSVAMNETAPYKNVLTHGYTVDAEGKKLSKSKGNYVALDKLVKQSGADILRLWVSSNDFRNEVSISDEIIKRNSDAYRRIRNTARFLLANLFDFNPAEHQVSGDQLIELDAWAIERSRQLQEEIIEAYDTYQFHSIYQKIHNFCAVDMGSFYLDIIKDRQYTTPVNSTARRSCQTAMFHIVQALTRWLAPILSFTAEEIWQFIPGTKSESIFLATWYDNWPELAGINMERWGKLQAVRDETNKSLEQKRKEGMIGSALAASVTLYAEPEFYELLTSLKEELRFLLITSKAQVLPMSSYASRPSDESLGIVIEVDALSDEKCERCWHRCEDVGQNSEHPTLCLRCVNNIKDNDEIRHFV